MANQRDATEALQARLDAVSEQRATAKRLFVARGIALWKAAEAEWAITHGEPLPPEKTN